MLKHLWQSLIAVLRRPRPTDEAYDLQCALYKQQLNTYQLQTAEGQRQSALALQEMIRTLQAMLKNTEVVR